MMSTRIVQCFIGLLMGAVSPLAAAAIINYGATLSGSAENPSNASPGTGAVVVTYDSVAHTLLVQASFSNLTGTTTASHIHCCTNPPGNIGVATYPGTFPAMPLGVTSGSFTYLVDLTAGASYTGAFVTNFGGNTIPGAEAALIAGLGAGRAYFNVHTTAFPGGEIRGFLQTVPEPQSLALTGLALLGLIWLRRPRWLRAAS